MEVPCLKSHLYQCESGAMFVVQYDSSIAPITFKCIQVADPDYRPCGPDLRPFLDNLWCVWGTQGLARPLLAEIAEEIMNDAIGTS